MTVQNNDVIRVTAKMHNGTTDVQNVYHIKANGTGGINDAAAVTLIKNRLDNMYAELVPQQTDDLIYDSIEIFNVTQDTPLDEVDWPTLVDGDVVGDQLPTQVAALVRFPTQAARTQGRKYIGGVIEGDNTDGGIPDADILAALQAYAVEMMTSFVAGSGSFLFGCYRDDPERFVQFTTHLVNTVWSTLRRRRLGQGS